MNQENVFYVYGYTRNKDSDIGLKDTFYYFGKGKGNRAYKNHGRLPVPKSKSNIIFISTNLSEEAAFNLEIEMIKKYGRVDLGNGILRNLTNGGNGFNGAIHPKRSKETNKKISNSLSGENHPNFGIPCPEYRKQKISNSMSGEKCYNFGMTTPDETKLKQSIALLGKEHEKVICPHCNKIGGKNLMTRYHFDNCRLNPLFTENVNSISDRQNTKNIFSGSVWWNDGIKSYRIKHPNIPESHWVLGMVKLNSK
jgi:hypothetical protein